MTTRSSDPVTYERRGTPAHIDDVAATLRRSPIRVPASHADSQAGRHVCSPASLANADGDHQSVVIDLSEDICRWARETGSRRRPNIVCGSLYELPLRPGSVDQFIVPAYTLQTLPKGVALLRQIYGALVPASGRLRTWWLVWPSGVAAQPTEFALSSDGHRSVYRVDSEGLTIERHDIRTAGLIERWRITAIRQEAVEDLVLTAGFDQLDWIGETQPRIESLAIWETECNA